MSRKVNKVFLRLKFDLHKKMPVSLNDSDLQLDEPMQSNTTSVLRRRAKTTNEMVDDAFIKLHTAKGRNIIFK